MNDDYGISYQFPSVILQGSTRMVTMSVRVRSPPPGLSANSGPISGMKMGTVARASTVTQPSGSAPEGQPSSVPTWPPFNTSERLERDALDCIHAAQTGLVGFGLEVVHVIPKPSENVPELCKDVNEVYWYAPDLIGLSLAASAPSRAAESTLTST